MSSQQGPGAATPFLDAIAERRTMYALTKESTIPDSRVEDIVKHALKYTPSSFNYQPTRAVALFNDQHDKLWDLTDEVLKGMLPADVYEQSTKGRIAGFRAARGTILFMDDKPTIRKQEADFPTYAANFQPWAGHSSGMAQFIVWTALEKEGLGCNLQHYGNLIERKVQEAFGISEEWTIQGQLVFGKPSAGPGEKTFKPMEEKFKSLGAQ